MKALNRSKQILKMSPTIIAFSILNTITAVASADDCKSKAEAVAVAVEKVYTAEIAKGTMITTTEVNQSESTKTWDVHFYAPNAGGQASYTIEMRKSSCEIANMKMQTE